ncbi:MAG: DeoR/GlpR family DNA-binding transcription regulator [Actinomycetaceae bacterium]|nr:DeoR/GlpR family DNA-binding transcription regulator [Arcanobacterium sp.]MDD7686921.1 DeoR/GlpR family DNA-binding transcription regulator [Actinomycetaceae bacterium]MDY5273747.1 DeoR/GlpR family DNA-binding transcription regulator [Arcanobacterium sp.]
MNRQERLSALLDLVVKRKTLHIDEIVQILGVSPATARRDLDFLANQQLVNRTRGGVMANPTSGEIPMRFRMVRFSDAKNKVARKAVSLINPGDVVALNGGTTTTEIGTEIGTVMASDFAFANDVITVVTNAVNIANDLAIRPQVRVVVSGGVVRARSYELVGPLAALILPHISVDKLFLGVTGIDTESGVFTDNEDEAAINQALVHMARETYVVADSSKVGTTAFAKITSWESVSALITDADIAPADAAAIEQHRVKVIRA